MSDIIASPEALRVIYVTCASLEEAERIGSLLVAEHLVACVNVLSGMTSIYRWEGKIERGHEVVLLAKTTLARTPAAIERVTSLHSYQVPCVVALPITEGNPEYLAWVRSAVEPNQPRP
jgi:periplasmic divalent cation tolerance protein